MKLWRDDSVKERLISFIDNVRNYQELSPEDSKRCAITCYDKSLESYQKDQNLKSIFQEG